jgi:2-oxoisovalerate dehydrogenase E1 component
MSLERLRRLHARFDRCLAEGVESSREALDLDPGIGRELMQTLLLTRHLDFAAHELRKSGEGHYTIGSAGHEANLVIGRLTRVSDLALLHYRSAAVYLERARQVPRIDAVKNLVASLVAAASDPASGGRHKVLGHRELGIIPQTSTISSHLPRAVGLAFSLGRRLELGLPPLCPEDAIVVASFGDASVNHSTWLGALNAAGWARHQALALPLLLVCEDNGLGISVPSPPGWIETRLRALPHVAYFHAPPGDVGAAYRAASSAVTHCRHERSPAVLHLQCVRLLGHWGGDLDQAYRNREELGTAENLDPLPRLARSLLAAGAASAEEIRSWDDRASERVQAAMTWAHDEPRLSSRAEIEAPLELAVSRDRGVGWPTITPVHKPLTLARGIRAALEEALTRFPEALLFGQDVGQKGGLYGVSRGLCQRFGELRVFDTLLDEQTILGIALGAGLSGLLPVAEIQYLAFLHNALDQLRGEAATLPFFSAGSFANPMLVRIPSFADPEGPGGHFHNEHSVAALRDVPGLVLGVPARADDAIALFRTAFQLARNEKRVVVMLEPTTLYRVSDLYRPEDDAWLAPLADEAAPLGRARVYGSGPADVVIATHGRGVWLSLRVARELAESSGLRARVLDLRWLAPLPAEDLLAHAAEVGRLLVVDDCRRSGGIAEAIGALVAERVPLVGFARVTAADCYVPIGPAAAKVLVSEAEILQTAQELCARR